MSSDLNNLEDVKKVVDEFYKKVNEDENLSYLFNSIAGVNWHDHLPKMYAFWGTVLLGKEGYKGNPMDAHFQLNKKHSLSEENFKHWLELFVKTVDDNFSGKNAELLKLKATSIARLMMFKLGLQIVI